MNRYNIIAKILGDFTINSVRDLKIRDDFDQLYLECSKPLFATNEFGLQDYSYQFWYDRAVQFGDEIKDIEPYSDVIKILNNIIEKSEEFSSFVERILKIILIISTISFFVFYYFFGFSLSGFFGIVITVFEAILLLLTFFTLFLLIPKKFFLASRDLNKTVMHRLRITPLQLEKEYATPEKIFVANIWQNSVKTKSIIWMLFLFTGLKKYFPNLFQILLFSIILVVPPCMADYMRNKNMNEFKKKLSVEIYEKIPVIYQKISDTFYHQIRTLISVVTGFTIILFFITCAFQNWPALVIELIIISGGMYDLIFKYPHTTS